MRTKTKIIISSQAELDPKDRPLIEMQEWCHRQGDIIVLKSGLILTSHLHSRSVQNCKAILAQRKLKSGKVVQATQSLIDILLADAEAAVYAKLEVDRAEVSVQQQRLRTLVKEALNTQASDIHIEVRKDFARIRFRKHGDLYLYAEWQAKLGREMASVAFNKETDHAISHFNPSVPQNASMPLNVDGIEVRLRLASMPAHGGFDMVMRVLATQDDRLQSLEELGYTFEQISLIEKAIKLPHGAIIISGPTGSGKTTTMATCMNMVDSNRKVYTIEDPIEKIIPHATQIPVNTEKEDRDFANMGKFALRMDPDIIVLGEMRDEETARVMVRAAITGHVVFSTLHTNSASAIVTRLVDLGVSPIMLSDPNLLACLISQRLVPVLCDACAKPLSDDMRERNTNSSCNVCQGLGTQGRTVIAEMIWVDDESREFIQKGDMLGWEKYLRVKGFKTYREHAIQLVKKGIVDRKDIERIIGGV